MRGFVLLLGCAASAPNVGGHGPMIDFIRHACTTLAADGLTAADVATRLGSIERDYGGALQIVVRPSDARFTRAEVMRAQGGQGPHSIELVPGEKLAVETLRASFGDYKEGILEGPNAPTELIFTTMKSGSRACTVIAQLADDGNVKKLMLRRD
jgi:hypothetical protein